MTKTKKKNNFVKISNFFTRTNLEITLLKRDIDKLPDCIDKFLLSKKYLKLNEAVTNIEMEYNMLKYISTNVKEGEKMSIDFSKYLITKLMTK